MARDGTTGQVSRAAWVPSSGRGVLRAAVEEGVASIELSGTRGYTGDEVDEVYHAIADAREFLHDAQAFGFEREEG